MMICQAAAKALGRSLLLDAQLEQESSDASELTGCGPVPDAFVHELYHYRLANRASDLDLLFGRSRRGALMNMVAPYNFVAVSSRAPGAAPTSTALASMCTGTILVVRAGQSSQGSINEASLHIIRAGGRVIGTVLDEAPVRLPPWIRRA